MKTAIIIPALNPDKKRLIKLVEELQKISDSAIIIVDDGSSAAFQPIFEQLRNNNHCIISHHAENSGKGTALKTGIRLAIQRYPALLGVVTADADGQHLPSDIVRIADALPSYPQSLILGVRDFSVANVPFKSRWGNRITSLVFYLGTKIRCPDTQTGLRGIPAPLIKSCLSVPGSRFEYEMNILTDAAKRRTPLVMIPIATVYLENNHSSHFHPVKDSARIYFHILKFGISSLACAATDLTFFTLLTYSLFDKSSVGILAATVAARSISGVLNFTLNKKWCFASHGDGFGQSIKYFVLFCTQILLSWSIVTLLSNLPVNLTILKMVTDSALFGMSYFVQRKFIFKQELSKNED